MRIAIKKTTNYQSEYTVTRDDKSVAVISLETKTYLTHDVCHYVVEKNLKYSNGFWGMLSKGHSFKELLGKDNPLTAELRLIEQIVGPVQSAYWGHIPRDKFVQFVEHLNFKIPDGVLDLCLTEIKNIIEKWRQLAVGQILILEWDHKTD